MALRLKNQANQINIYKKHPDNYVEISKLTKIEQVTFHIPQTEDGKDDYLKEWKFTSSDNKINLTFKPIFDRYDNANVIIIKSLQHQVFGKFSGTIRVDEEVIEIKDLVGFAEKVQNRW